MAELGLTGATVPTSSNDTDILNEPLVSGGDSDFNLFGGEEDDTNLTSIDEPAGASSIFSEASDIGEDSSENNDLSRTRNGLIAQQKTSTQAAEDRKLALEAGVPNAAISDTTRDELKNKLKLQQVRERDSNAPVTESLFDRDMDLITIGQNSKPNLIASEKIARQMTFSDSFGRTVDTSQEAFFRTIEAFSEAFGFESLEAKAQFKAEVQQGQASEYKGKTIDVFEGDINSWESLSNWVSQTSGMLIPNMALVLAGAKTGAYTGGTIGTFIAPGAGTALGATIGSVSGAFLSSLVLGAGFIQSAIKKIDKDIEAPGIVFGGGAIVGALDSILPISVMSMLSKKFGVEAVEAGLRKLALKEVAKRASKATGTGMVVESFTEGVQTFVEELSVSQATGRDMDTREVTRNIVNAMAAGWLGGTVNLPASLVQSRRQNKAVQEFSNLQRQSELEQLAADKSTEVRVAQMQAAGIESVFVPVETLVTWASRFENPQQALEQLGMTVDGTTAEISLETFVSQISGKEGAEAFNNNLAISKDTQTVSEATAEVFADPISETVYLDELADLAIAEDLRTKVEETIRKATAEPRKSADILEDAGQQVTNVIDSLIAISAQKKIDTSVAEVEGRLAFLDQEISQQETRMSEVEVKIENAELQGESTTKLEKQLEKLSDIRNVLLDEQLEINVSAQKAGLIEEFEQDIVPGEGRTPDLSKVLGRFEDKAIKFALRTLRETASRETIVLMSPEEFISIAEEGFDPTKAARVAKISAEGGQFSDIPYMSMLMQEDGSAKIISHEGRHRVRQFAREGVRLIPVRLVSGEGGPALAIRWGEDPRRPTMLRPQEGAVDRLAAVPFVQATIEDLSATQEVVATTPKTKAEARAKKKIITKAQTLQKLGVAINKESVRAAKQAFRAALRAGKVLTEAKKEIRKALDATLKGTAVTAEQRKRMGDRVSNAPTLEALKKVTAKEEARALKLMDQARRKQIKAAIEKLLKQHKTKMTGKPKGKLTPEISDTIDNLSGLLNMAPENAELELANRQADPSQVPSALEKIERMALGVAVQDPKLTDIVELEKLLTDLQDVISEGKTINKNNAFAEAKRIADLRIEFRNLLDPVINTTERLDEDGNAVLDENGDPVMIEERGGNREGGRIKKTLLKMEVAMLGASGAWWNKIARILRSSDRVRVNAFLDSISLFDEARTAELGRYTTSNRLQELMQEATGISSTNLLKFMQDLSTTQVNLGKFPDTANNLQPLIMNRGELLQLVAELQQPSIESKARNKKGDAFSQDMIDALRNEVTTQEYRMISALTKFYNEYYTRINKVYRKAEGVNLPQEELYIPISRLGDSQTDEFLKAILYRGAPGSGALTSRTQSVKPLRRRNFYAVATSHIAEMEYYIAYHDKVRILMSVFDGNTLSNIERTYNEHYRQMIAKDIEYFSRKGVQAGSIVEQFLVTNLRNFAVGTLAVRPLITIKQLLSFPAFAEGISSLDFALGIGHLISHPKQAWKDMNDSQFFNLRGNRRDQDFADLSADAFGNRVLNVLGRNPRLTSALTLNIRIGDKGAILLGGYAHFWAKRRALIKSGVSPQEAKKRALRSMEKIAVRTQQSYDPDQVSEQQRSSGYGRVLALFKSSANALARAEYSAIVERARGRTTNAEVAKAIVIFHLVIPNLLQFASNYGWDEEKQIRASIWGAANGLFIVGDLLDYISQQIIGDGDPYSLDIRHPLQMFADVTEAIEEMAGYTFGDVTDEIKVLEKTFEAVQNLLGVPSKSIYNMLRGVDKTLDAKTGGVPLSLGWSTGAVKEKNKNSPYMKDRDLK